MECLPKTPEHRIQNVNRFVYGTIWSEDQQIYEVVEDKEILNKVNDFLLG